MIQEWQSRTRLMVGEEGNRILEESSVLVVGAGGVGGYTAEYLARAGVGRLVLVDHDRIQPSNRNRQIHALLETEGDYKAEVLAERLRSINPRVEVVPLVLHYDAGKEEEIFRTGPFHHVVDAIDTLTPKVLLLEECLTRGFPVVSSMGAGGKWDPSLVQVAEIGATHHCRLAAYLRKMLHKKGIRTGFKAVFSPEPVRKESLLRERADGKASVVGTLSYMPALFAAHAASVVLRRLLEENRPDAT